MLTGEEEKIRLQLVKIVKHLHCSICLNLMTNPSMTQCLHRFCHSCICKSIQSSSGDYCRCPLCNEKITKRSLREQTELSDIIESVKKVVGLFESDNQLTSITADDEIVVFDASTDKSRSDDSFFEDIECIDVDDSSNDKKIEDKSNKNCNKEELICSKDTSDVENNRKSLPTTTITSVSDDCWPTCEDSIDCNDLTNNETNDLTNNETNDMTDIYANSTSIADNSIKGLNKLETDESTEIINETQMDNEINAQTDKSKSVLAESQNLLFTKPKITYSTTRKSGDDLFDRIITNSKINDNHTKTKVENSENKSIETKDKRNDCRNLKDERKKSSSSYDRHVSSETEDECEELSMPEVKERKPLAQNNDRHEQKKKFKRVQRFDSSDEDNDSPLVLNRKRKAQTINESGVENDSTKEYEIPESDVESSDDELLMTSIHKNVSVENNRKSVSFKSDDRDDYNSDEQLITSSPFSSSF